DDFQEGAVAANVELSILPSGQVDLDQIEDAALDPHHLDLLDAARAELALDSLGDGSGALLQRDVLRVEAGGDAAEEEGGEGRHEVRFHGGSGPGWAYPGRSKM